MPLFSTDEGSFPKHSHCQLRGTQGTERASIRLSWQSFCYRTASGDSRTEDSDPRRGAASRGKKRRRAVGAAQRLLLPGGGGRTSFSGSAGCPAAEEEEGVSTSRRTSPPFRRRSRRQPPAPLLAHQARDDFAAGRIPRRRPADRRGRGDRRGGTDAQEVVDLGRRMGEFRRATWHMDFHHARRVSKARERRSSSNRRATSSGCWPCYTSTARSTWTTPSSARTSRVLNQVTTAVPKQTIPSPNMVHYARAPDAGGIRPST